MSKPYAFINDDMETYFWLKDNSVSGTKARAKFDAVNSHILNEVVLPGQLVIVGDDSTHMCTLEEQDLMYFARDTNEALISSSYPSSLLLTRNYDLLQSILTYGSIGIGSSTAAWSKHLGAVEKTLKEIEALYQRLRSGNLTRDQFIAQRKILFSQLETHLQGAGRYGTSLKNNTSIRHMLGVSTKSYLHSGDIPGYANRISGIAKASRALSKGTYVGMALDVGSTALEIQEACSTGREEKCTNAKYVESGKLMFGIGGASAGGFLGAATAGIMCLAVGIPTGGVATLGCAIIGGAAGGWSGGKGGSMMGESAGQRIYNVVSP